MKRVHARAHVSSIRLDAIAHFAAPARVAGNARESLAVQAQARFLRLRDKRRTSERRREVRFFGLFAQKVRRGEKKKAVSKTPTKMTDRKGTR